MSTTCYTQNNGTIYTNTDQRPCGTGTGIRYCCAQGDQCGGDGFCHFTHAQDKTITGFYLGGCTDRLHADAICPQHCSGVATQDVVFSSGNSLWKCCYGSGSLNCDIPSVESFLGPSPNDLLAAIAASTTVGPAAFAASSPVTPATSSPPSAPSPQNPAPVIPLPVAPSPVASSPAASPSSASPSPASPALASLSSASPSPASLTSASASLPSASSASASAISSSTQSSSLSAGAQAAIPSSAQSSSSSVGERLATSIPTVVATSSSSTSTVATIAPAVIIPIIAIVGGIVALIWYRRRRRTRAFELGTDNEKRRYVELSARSAPGELDAGNRDKYRYAGELAGDHARELDTGYYKPVGRAHTHELSG